MNPEMPHVGCGEYMRRLEWGFSCIDATEDERRVAVQRKTRRARSQDSIMYCRCGSRSHVVHSPDWRNRIDVEMGQVSRIRECPKCGAKEHTIEVRESELQELRRKAHLWVMHCATT